MSTAYLGIILDIFNAILEFIFKPVFNFLGKIVSTIVSWVFNTILVPILMPIISSYISFMIEIFLRILASALYNLMIWIFRMIDFIANGFFVLIGSRNITYSVEVSEGVYQTLETTFLEYVLTVSPVKDVYYAVLIFCVVLLVGFSIYAVMRSAADFELKGKMKTPILRVMGTTLRSLLSLMIFNIFVIIMLRLAGVVMAGVTLAFSPDTNSSCVDSKIGTNLFLMATMKAANSKANVENYVYRKEYRNSPRMNDGLRKMFTDTSNSNYIDYKDEKNKAKIIGDSYWPEDATGLFIINDMDLVLGIIAGVAVLFFMVMTFVIAVARVYEITVLFIAGPFFVASSPLDDGMKYKYWRDKFIGKVFAGLSGFLAMNVYIIFTQIALDGGISFGDGVTAEMDSVIRIFLVVGGAWAIKQSFTLLSSFFDPDGSEKESQFANGVFGALWGKSVGYAANKINSAIKQRYKNTVNEIKQKREMARRARAQDKLKRKAGGREQFKDMKNFYGARANVGRNVLAPDNNTRNEGTNEAPNGAASGRNPSPSKGGGGGAASAQSASPAAAEPRRIPKKGDRFDSRGIGTESRYMGLKKNKYNEEGALEQERFGPLGLVKRFTEYKRDNDGKLIMGKDGKPIKTASTISILGGLLKIRKNSDGSFGGISLFGGALKVNKTRNSTGVSILGIGGNKGKDGSYGFNVWNMIKGSKDKDGNTEFSALKTLKVARNSDKKLEKFQLAGFKAERIGTGKNSRMKLTGALGGKYKMHYTEDQDGKITKAFTQRNRWIDGSSEIYIAKPSPVDVDVDVNKISAEAGENRKLETNPADISHYSVAEPEDKSVDENFNNSAWSTINKSSIFAEDEYRSRASGAKVGDDAASGRTIADASKMAFEKDKFSNNDYALFEEITASFDRDKESDNENNDSKGNVEDKIEDKIYKAANGTGIGFAFSENEEEIIDYDLFADIADKAEKSLSYGGGYEESGELEELENKIQKPIAVEEGNAVFEISNKGSVLSNYVAEKVVESARKQENGELPEDKGTPEDYNVESANNVPEESSTEIIKDEDASKKIQQEAEEEAAKKNSEFIDKNRYEGGEQN